MRKKRQPDWILTVDEGDGDKHPALLKRLTDAYVDCLSAGLRPHFHVLEASRGKRKGSVWGRAWRDFMESDGRRGPLILGKS